MNHIPMKFRPLSQFQQYYCLIYKVQDPDIARVLFASGKLVCTEAVNEKMVYDTVEKLMAEISERSFN